MVAKTAESKPVVELKWEATPRCACNEMSAVSPRLATPTEPSRSQPAAFRRGRKVMTQASDAHTRANDNENSRGLRHDNGPSQGRSSSPKTAACKAALTKNRAESR